MEINLMYVDHSMARYPKGKNAQKGFQTAYRKATK